jgi:hypothetical protein
MTAAARELVDRHLQALLTEAGALGIEHDLTGRLMLDAIVAHWRQTRSTADIASELEFARANLDPDAEYTFMRP